MQATEILMDEHRTIERLLSALDKMASRLWAGEEVHPSYFIEAADFIQGYADGCHHAKEENVLFIAMQEHGVPVQGGPIGVMLQEHEQGRTTTRAMRQAAERWEAGDTTAINDVIQHARGYTSLLHQHIAKEDGILFPMAERALPPAGHEQLLAEFKRVNNEEIGEDVFEKYLDLADRLEKEANSVD